MFKVGDKVKIINPYSQDESYRGDVVTISKVDDDDSDRFFVKENCRPWRSREVALVKEYKMNRKDLKDGDIVTLRNGDRLILIEESFVDYDGDEGNSLCDLDDLRYDLTYKSWHDDSSNDIVKVERPVKFETVFERKEEEVKEMTVDEVSKELGFKVKIVGEDR